MESFYKGLKNGKNKSEALQAAKIAFLTEANEIESNPFFWGYFYIMGDNSPIDFLSSNKSGHVLSILICMLLLSFFFIGRKSSKTTD